VGDCPYCQAPSNRHAQGTIRSLHVGLPTGPIPADLPPERDAGLTPGNGQRRRDVAIGGRAGLLLMRGVRKL
jgi:hypothetical protein